MIKGFNLLKRRKAATGLNVWGILLLLPQDNGAERTKRAPQRSKESPPRNFGGHKNMKQNRIRAVSFENQTISYCLEQKPVKNLNLRIRKDGSVYVSANPAVPLERVDAFVSSKGKYIRNAQEKFRQIAARTPKPKRYVSGENFSILGKSLCLQVTSGEQEAVYSDGISLHLQVKDPEDFARKQWLTTRFMDRQCREIFGEVIAKIYPVFQKYGVAMPTLRIRDMETRWGSCLPNKGVITLNKKLLAVSIDCIEYVVMHEFCHFIHPNHSKQFYTVLTMLMPDWKERDRELKRQGEYR